MQSEITIKTIPAYFIHPDGGGKFPAIILIHEVWGLTSHIRDVADRLMAQGYAVLAPDLLSHTGITAKVDQSIMKEVQNPATRDEAQKKLRAIMAPIQSPEFGKQTVESLQQCFAFLENSDKVNGKIAVMGFCFGGTYAWHLAVAEPDLECAVAFYGHAPLKEDDLAQINCPVLAFYGENDSNLMQQLPELEGAMDKLEKNYDFVKYPGVGHAFFNDTNPVTYNKDAAEDAWAKTLEFLTENI